MGITDQINSKRIDDRLEREAVEKQLWKDFRSNHSCDENVTNLIEFYLPLVVKIVKQIAIQTGYQTRPNELIGAGVIGLHEAVFRFEEDKACSFSSFAALRIRGAVLDELRKIDPLSRRQRSAVKKIKKLEQEFTEKNSRAPELAELANMAGISEDEVQKILNLSQQTLSLQNEAGDGLEFIDTIEDISLPSPSDAADRKTTLELLTKCMKKLPDREQQLLYFRHFKQLSVKEIAEVFEVSVGRVSQLYNDAILHLRQLMEQMENHLS